MKKIVSVLTCFILLSLPIVSLCVTQQELTEQRTEIQNNIQDAKDKQQEIRGQMSATEKELNSLNDEIDKKQYEIDQITTELNQLTSEVNKLQAQLDEAQEKYDGQYDLLCKRIFAQYKRGKVSYLDVLLGSNNLSEFISNYYLIEKIAEIDTELLNDIKEQKNIIETSKKEVDSKKAVVEEKNNQLKIEKVALSNKQLSKQKYMDQLTDEEKAAQKELDEFNEQLRQNDIAIANLAAQAGGGGNYSGGQLYWPAPSYTRISSTFGYRGSAATGGVGTADHNGYDLAAPNRFTNTCCRIWNCY